MDVLELLERFEDLEALGGVGSFQARLRPTEHASWTAGLSRIFGIPDRAGPAPLDELLAHVHPDDQETLIELIRSAAESGSPFETPGRVVRPDGSVRHVLVRGRARPGANDRPDAVSGVVVDVTDQKRTEDELAVKARVLDLMRDSVFVLDGEGRFVDANEAAYRTRGYTRGEFLALDLRVLDTPEFAGRVGERIAEITSAGGALFESAHRRKDGTVMPVEINSRLVEAAGGRFIVSTVRDISSRKATEEALHRSAEELRRGIASLEVRNQQISGLATMGRELQACSSSEEVWRRAATFVEQLFPGSGGQLAVSRGQGSPLFPVAEWGPPREPCLKALGDCPAVRAAGLEGGELQASFGCREEGIEAGRFCICVPIETLGEPLGLLRLWEPDGHGLSVEDAVASHYGDLAVAVAEQISPVLSNLSLREALRDLAMRDPLTGLYNRRFLEEALAREVSRAAREKEPLGVLMLDLDHFKDFNDAFGHEAGDDVLRCVGQFLRHRIRTTDVACRYGGEEFTILLPGATLEDARARAEQIRAGIRAALGSPGNVAASLGVAVFPDHGDSLAGLLRAADVALYRAKALGRDRVEIFGEG